VHAQPPVLLGMTSRFGTHLMGTLVSYTAGADSVVNLYNLRIDSGMRSGYWFQDMTQAPNGKFYGLTATAAYLNSYSPGYLFEYDYVTGTFTPKVAFDSMSGYRILSALTLSQSGLMYSVTGYGGANNAGTIFSYKPGDTAVAKLYDMPDSAFAITSLLQIRNDLYGMTSGDGTNRSGTLFRFNIRTNAYTVLFSFPFNAHPIGRLTLIGDTLYGMTQSDGSNLAGTLFRYIIGQSTDTVLYNFQTAYGYPSSDLTLGPDGLLYGLTSGSVPRGFGTMFNFNPGTDSLQVLHNFRASTYDGISPWGGMTLGTDSIFYGMTGQGGVNNAGTVFTYNSQTGAYNKVADLSHASGGYPDWGHMVQYFTPPVLTSSPQSRTICPGTGVTLTAAATGQALRYQWIVSTDGGSSYTYVTGATSSNYTLTATAAEDGYLYRTLVSNNGGIDTSTAAIITVTHINDSVTSVKNVCASMQAGAAYQWLDCNTGQPISGATAQSYTATVNGSYSCVIMLNGCTDTTACQIVRSVGINNIEEYNIRLSPNPTSGILTVSNINGGEFDLEIVNMIGAELMRASIAGTKTDIDMSALPDGIYEVRITIERAVRAQKVVKIH
jgi:uncharacterized repeat protein (TIGR03803 family)